MLSATFSTPFQDRRFSVNPRCLATLPWLRFSLLVPDTAAWTSSNEKDCEASNPGISLHYNQNPHPLPSSSSGSEATPLRASVLSTCVWESFARARARAHTHTQTFSHILIHVLMLAPIQVHFKRHTLKDSVVLEVDSGL